MIKKAVLSAGYCFGASRVGCGEKDVAQAAQHNGHYTPPTQPTGQTTECHQLEAPLAQL